MNYISSFICKGSKFLKAAYRFFSILIAFLSVFEGYALGNLSSQPVIQDSTSQSEYSKKLQKIGENGYLQSLEEVQRGIFDLRQLLLVAVIINRCDVHKQCPLEIEKLRCASRVWYRPALYCVYE